MIQYRQCIIQKQSNWRLHKRRINQHSINLDITNITKILRHDPLEI